MAIISFSQPTDFTINSGYAYSTTIGNALTWSISGAEDLTGLTVHLIDHVTGATIANATVVASGPSTIQQVAVDLTSSQTSALDSGTTYAYRLAAISSPNEILLAVGKLTVLPPF